MTLRSSRQSELLKISSGLSILQEGTSVKFRDALEKGFSRRQHLARQKPHLYHRQRNYHGYKKPLPVIYTNLDNTKVRGIGDERNDKTALVPIIEDGVTIVVDVPVENLARASSTSNAGDELCVIIPFTKNGETKFIEMPVATVDLSTRKIDNTSGNVILVTVPATSEGKTTYVDVPVHKPPNIEMAIRSLLSSYFMSKASPSLAISFGRGFFGTNNPSNNPRGIGSGERNDKTTLVPIIKNGVIKFIDMPLENLARATRTGNYDNADELCVVIPFTTKNGKTKFIEMPVATVDLSTREIDNTSGNVILVTVPVTRKGKTTYLDIPVLKPSSLSNIEMARRPLLSRYPMSKVSPSLAISFGGGFFRTNNPLTNPDNMKVRSIGSGEKKDKTVLIPIFKKGVTKFIELRVANPGLATSRSIAGNELPKCL
uniref:Uncharacterized protein n=1 Tax=Strigamia maritima TaxID=126957 RepID=T1IT82_STRMM